ncbi:MAG: haloacid dehalogenase [Candidatus Marinimicrobia bacterium]|nr:haloacid dehalogenase [Candidatus Neomarinimicrobiota bacterium]|tara:strand:+ start:653 stop:1117 length:465 start_codon:yes stop_codon:yes gene_type:complete
MKNTLDLIVYDFDGVMTNDYAYIDNKGNEFVQVSRKDGLGVSLIKKLGIKQIIMSSEHNKVVTSRAEKLNIKCIQGIKNKKDTLSKYCVENNFDLEKVGFIGNDLNDLEAMSVVGKSFCPADANKKIKDVANFVMNTNGGNGVIRELYDLICEG